MYSVGRPGWFTYGIGGEADMEQALQNPLGTEKIPQLLTRFAVPSVIAMLVSSLYNIVDQIFIGQGVGVLGNAATNVAFPLVTVCTATALLFGIGGAANFNLCMGAGKKEEAAKFAGGAVTLLIGGGIVLCILTLLFLEPLMWGCGATADTIDYALTYTGITAFGFPFLILSNGGGHLIRADGAPRFSMLCNLTGAMINTILDPLFIFPMGLGIAGAAWATVIGQVVSGIMAVVYLSRFRTVRLTRGTLRPGLRRSLKIASLGAANCFNQLAMMVVQITLNNTLTFYGALSVYGKEIPLACAGIISKVNMIFFSFAIGLAQGLQPICSFNYGAKKYARVRETYRLALIAATCISFLAFLCFQLFPRQIISIFGNGTEEYFHFAEQYFRIYLFFTFLNGIQPVTTNLFTAIGKASRGIFLSLTRQILFLLPLIVLLPALFGIDGIMFAGPVADLIAAVLSLLLAGRELRRIRRMESPLCETQPAR